MNGGRSGGFSIDPTAESLDALPRAIHAETGVSASDITEERAGIIASSSKIEVKKLTLLGSIIVRKPGGSEALEVITDDYHESSLHDSRTGYNLGFGVTVAGAGGSSFGAEISVAAGEVDQIRAVEAGTYVDGAEDGPRGAAAGLPLPDKFTVDSGGFAGREWSTDLSWAPIVDAEALQHAWSGGAAGIGARVFDGVRAAARDAAEPVMKLINLGGEFIAVPAAISAELEQDRELLLAVAANEVEEAFSSDEGVIARLQAELEAEEKLVTEAEGGAARGNALANSDATLNLFQGLHVKHREEILKQVQDDVDQKPSSRGVSRGDPESTAPSRATGHGEGWDGGAADAPSGEVRIASTFGRLLGPSEAHASSASFAAEQVVLSPAVAEFLGSSFTALSVKYGPRVAKFLITKVVPRAIPGVGAAFLAKDLYDAGRAAYHEFTAPDEEASKPQILSTPALEPAGPNILATPGPTERELGLGTLPGFEVDSAPREWTAESFPDHSDLAKEMMIFYKKGEADGADAAIRKFGVAKGESPVWKELQPYRGSIRTNGETGSKQRFYEWDHLHGEIEVYGPGGKQHLGAMDPVTGKIYKPGEPGRNVVKKLK